MTVSQLYEKLKSLVREGFGNMVIEIEDNVTLRLTDPNQDYSPKEITID